MTVWTDLFWQRRQRKCREILCFSSLANNSIPFWMTNLTDWLMHIDWLVHSLIECLFDGKILFLSELTTPTRLQESVVCDRTVEVCCHPSCSLWRRWQQTQGNWHGSATTATWPLATPHCYRNTRPDSVSGVSLETQSSCCWGKVSVMRNHRLQGNLPRMWVQLRFCWCGLFVVVGLCKCVCVCVCVYIYIYIYIYIYSIEENVSDDLYPGQPSETMWVQFRFC